MLMEVILNDRTIIDVCPIVGLNRFIQQKASVETCAICRKLLCDLCLECRAKKYHILDENDITKIWNQKIDSIKLALQETDMISMLPKELMGIILNYTTFDVFIKRQCTIACGKCNHYFHHHCINKWLKKRPMCPLDNREWVTQQVNNYDFCKLEKVEK